jgi:hypothetical protein
MKIKKIIKNLKKFIGINTGFKRIISTSGVILSKTIKRVKKCLKTLPIIGKHL